NGDANAPPSAPTKSLATADGTVGRANPQALVAFYIDRCREVGADPPQRVIGQVARQLGELAGETANGRPKCDGPTLEVALALMLAKRLPPSMLPSLVVEAQAGPAAPRRAARPEHPADAALRRAGVDPSRLLDG